jgi:hypothetical protein
MLESVCAANPRRLAEIRDSDRNLAASVRAVSELETMAGNQARAGFDGAPSTPGLTIVITQSAPEATKTAKVIEPLPSHDKPSE